MQQPRRSGPGAIPDDTLAEQAQSGDVTAFNALVERYQRPVFGLSLRMLGSPAAAEDAAQEAFFSAWRAIDRYRGGSFQAWILRIAGNQCRDELRRRKRRPSKSLDGLMEVAGEAVAGPARTRSPEQQAMDGELGAVLQTALNILPPDQRQAIILSDIHALAYSEIAQVMATSVGTVKSRISRGRARLRTYLLERGELSGTPRRRTEQEESTGPSPARSQS